jgi:hypothetical protein
MFRSLAIAIALSMFSTLATAETPADPQPQGKAVSKTVFVSFKDSDATPIKGARVTVDAERAKFDKKQGWYSAEVRVPAAGAKRPRQVALKFSHPKFDDDDWVLELVGEQPRYLNLVMRRVGQPYIVHASHDVPVERRPQELLVHLAVKSSASADEMRAKMDALAKKQGLDVTKHYSPSSAKTGQHRALFSLRRRDGKRIADRGSRLLEKLRGHEDVAFAGPLFFQGNDEIVPRALAPNVVVRIGRKEAKAVRVRLEEFGRVRRLGPRTLQIDLKPDCGWAAVSIAERITHVSGVQAVDSGVYVLKQTTLK